MQYLKKFNENFSKIKTIEEETPLKPGYIRLYHNTSKENLSKILEEGLDPNKNRERSEGSITWLDTEKHFGYGGHTIFIDMPIDEIIPHKVNNTQYTYPLLIEPEKIKVCEVPIIYKTHAGAHRTSEVIKWINEYGLDRVNQLRTRKAFRFDDENWNKYIEPLLR